jgi:formate dehydrogenase subunit gamma
MAVATTKTGSTSSAELRRLVAPYAEQIGGPISALRAVQHEFGWIDDNGRDTVADVFNLSRAEVRGLIEFYADFRTSPPAAHVVTICGAEACQAAGSRTLTKKVVDRLGVELGQVAADRSVELGSVACLGLCARAPAMRVDDRLVVEADRVIDQLLDELPS